MSMELSDKERLEVARELGDEAITRLACVEKIRWKKFNVLTSGFVCLVDVMGDDYSVVQAARVSYGAGTKKVSDDRTLIRYLLRHRHTTPFEMAEIKLLVKCPMDVWRQWILHRNANVNEYSTRYSVAIDEADRTNPDAWRLQSGRNKQGSEGLVTAWPDGYTVEEVQDGYTVKHPDRDDFFCGDATSPGAYLSAREEAAQNTMRVLYEERVDQFGVAREQARKDLPLSTYTMAYWKIDLHNLLHFLGLWMDSHAQQEIRRFADAIGYGIVAPLFPMVWEAFVNYRMHATFVSEPAKEVLEYLLIRFGDSGDELWVNQGVYTKDAFDVAVTELFPKWMKRDDEGNLKPHREREEVRSTLTQLGLVSGE